MSTTIKDANQVLKAVFNEDTNSLNVTVAEADMGPNTIKGNNTGSPAQPMDLTPTEVTAMLDEMEGDSGSGGAKGLVPAQVSGDASKFLRGDGTWQTAGGGAITTLYFNSDIRVNVGAALGWFNMVNNSIEIPAGTWYIDTHFTFSSNTAPNLADWETIGGGLYFADGDDTFTEPTETHVNATLLAGGGLQISTGAPVVGQGATIGTTTVVAATATIRGPFYIYTFSAPTTVFAVPYGKSNDAGDSSVYSSLFAFKIA